MASAIATRAPGSRPVLVNSTRVASYKRTQVRRIFLPNSYLINNSVESTHYWHKVEGVSAGIEKRVKCWRTAKQFHLEQIDDVPAVCDVCTKETKH